ncbi:MAG: metallophosphoesterase [Verrucomicrobiota bacterium]
MKTIAHISDLHFGKETPAVAEGLVADLAALKPTLVVASGDFTQRARSSQFRAARDYLARLPKPQLVVPGNHDVPLFDVVRRFATPLRRYRRFISADLDPTYSDDEMIVVGLNTARSFTWKNGRISVEQIDALQGRLNTGGLRVKVVVTHHPFLPPPGDVGIDLVGRAARAMKVLDACNVDLLLAGHLHRGYAGDVRTHYPAARRAMIAVQAGTAISHRIREGEPNAYNLLHVARTHTVVEVRAWNGSAFATLRRTTFDRADDGWHAKDTKKD